MHSFFAKRNTTSKESPTLPTPEPISQPLCISQHLIPRLLIHKSPTKRHITITIPDPLEFIPFFVIIFRICFMDVYKGFITCLALERYQDYDQTK